MLIVVEKSTVAGPWGCDNTQSSELADHSRGAVGEPSHLRCGVYVAHTRYTTEANEQKRKFGFPPPAPQDRRPRRPRSPCRDQRGARDYTARHTAGATAQAQHHGPASARGVSSYMWEGWPEPYRGLNEPFSLVNSLENRVLVHCDRSYESRVANGRRGGRPPKRPTWDVTPGSGRLANLQPIETRVTGLEETGSAQMWPLSGPYSDD